MFEQILAVVHDGRHLVVMGPDGTPVCMNACIHDEEFKAVYRTGDEQRITALVLTRLAKEFNDQAQRLNAEYN